MNHTGVYRTALATPGLLNMRETKLIDGFFLDNITNSFLEFPATNFLLLVKDPAAVS